MGGWQGGEVRWWNMHMQKQGRRGTAQYTWICIHCWPCLSLLSHTGIYWGFDSLLQFLFDIMFKDDMCLIHIYVAGTQIWRALLFISVSQQVLLHMKYFLMFWPHKHDFMLYIHLQNVLIHLHPGVFKLSAPPTATHSPTIPTHPDFSKLAVAQFLYQLEGFTGNLPHILGLHW